MERATFAALALGVLVNLNDDSAARYGLRPSEFERWRAKFKDIAHP